MFYRYGYAEHPAITHCRQLINEAMTHDDMETLKVARELLDGLLRAQKSLTEGDAEVQNLLNNHRAKRKGVHTC